MEINVTKVVAATIKNPFRFSASFVEIGEYAGEVTWRNALNQRLLKLNKDEVAAFKEYAADFGAWEDDEIAEWTNNEATALFVQLVSGDCRELSRNLLDHGATIEDSNDEQYEKATANGGESLYKSGGEWFYSICS